jgi:GntR family transcriptional regulator
VFDDRTPIYRQIAEQIRGQILDGTVDEGQQVMSTTQYASFYRINPATAAKGFQELVDEEILVKRRGIGMFVAPGARERLREERRARFFDEVVEPMIAEARAIGVPLTSVVAHIETHLESSGSTQDGAEVE